MDVVKASYTDTLLQIARDHDLGFTELRAANPEIDPWLPGEGTEVILPKWHLLPDSSKEGIVINLAEMRLYFFENEDLPPRSFPIGIGREGFATPIGETFVSWKREAPTWTPTPDMREANPDLPQTVPSGPDNPLGTHAVYLGWPSYLMHGTSKPWGIGRRVSSGCIRLYPEDIVTFYNLAEKKMKVQVINQPVKMAWIDHVLYVEAHPHPSKAIEVERFGESRIYDVPDGFVENIERLAGVYKEQLDWGVIQQILQERKGYPFAVFVQHPYGDRVLR